MDPETQRHFAALIMEEAARLRLQAGKEGVQAYLAKHNVRGKPNPQFLKATVRSIAQANRAAEINGMWKRRAQELELEERERKKSRHRHKGHSNNKDSDRLLHNDCHQSKGAACKLVDDHGELRLSPMSKHDTAMECVSNVSLVDVAHHEDEGCLEEYVDNVGNKGLEDEEMERFLHSRVKRGRGAVGSRMDEAGPYPSVGSKDNSDVRVKEEWEQRILGPSKEVYERQVMLESKKKKKSKLEMDRPQSSEHVSKHKDKGKKQNKTKHRHSLKKMKKVDARRFLRVLDKTITEQL